VIDNLLRNAIEASPPNGQVDIITRTERDATRIEIIDRGPGLPADRVAELFEPFFTPKASGTGLGLVLARSTIEAHGGTLTYQRRDDCTVFAIQIPLVPRDAGHEDRITS
jgi:signal transduction histidine kinase